MTAPTPANKPRMSRAMRQATANLGWGPLSSSPLGDEAERRIALARINEKAFEQEVEEMNNVLEANIKRREREESVRRGDTRVPTNPCLCGCGDLSTNNFRQGHDSRLASRLLKYIRAQQANNLPINLLDVLPGPTLDNPTLPSFPIALLNTFYGGKFREYAPSSPK